MQSLSSFTAHQLAGTVDLTTTRRLLDLGGGGAYAVELCRRWPDLEVSIFDLPPVCKITEPVIAESALIDRVSLIPGDFFTDAALSLKVLHPGGRRPRSGIHEKGTVWDLATITIPDMLMVSPIAPGK
jgi:hypothetical protein